MVSILFCFPFKYFRAVPGGIPFVDAAQGLSMLSSSLPPFSLVNESDPSFYSDSWDTSFCIQAMYEANMLDEFPEVSRKAWDYFERTQILSTETSQ